MQFEVLVEQVSDDDRYVDAQRMILGSGKVRRFSLPIISIISAVLRVLSWADDMKIKDGGGARRASVAMR